MTDIIYDVSVSIDGFISGRDGDVSGFPMEGPHVDAYMERLGEYSQTIMGRGTYEFGYAFGMKPGARAYPHMPHYIFSKGIDLPDNAEVEVVRDNWLDTVDRIKAAADGDIYLCGGGTFAGFLLANGRIDLIRLKRVPILCGGGTPLFAGTDAKPMLELTDQKTYDYGAIYQEYRVL